MKDIKAIRGQLRQIAQELLPTLLTQEIVKSAFEQLRKHIDKQLAVMDQRQKDILAYSIRQSAIKTEEVKK